MQVLLYNVMMSSTAGFQWAGANETSLNMFRFSIRLVLYTIMISLQWLITLLKAPQINVADGRGWEFPLSVFDLPLLYVLNITLPSANSQVLAVTAGVNVSVLKLNFIAGGR